MAKIFKTLAVLLNSLLLAISFHSIFNFNCLYIFFSKLISCGLNFNSCKNIFYRGYYYNCLPKNIYATLIPLLFILLSLFWFYLIFRKQRKISAKNIKIEFIMNEIRYIVTGFGIGCIWSLFVGFLYVGIGMGGGLYFPNIILNTFATIVFFILLITSFGIIGGIIIYPIIFAIIGYIKFKKDIKNNIID